MKIFEILNVGQGDSIIMRPPEGCNFTGKTFIIDMGPGKYNITEHVDDCENIHIILTHHDNDHIGGMKFFIGRMKQVTEITVPFYQNEITLIARAILNLKGINSSKDCNEFIKELEAIVNNQVTIKALLNENRMHMRLSFAYEGKPFCDHIECLNPPFMIKTYDWLREMKTDELIQLAYELFTKSFAKEMELYIRANSDEHNSVYYVDSREFNDYWLYDEEDISQEASYAKCNYVLDFIMENVAMFRKFNAKGSRENLRRIYSGYVKCAHDVCIVLKTSYEETMLLTGDASKKVFKRLINEGVDISATYLKVPHHGSKHNISKKILATIHPEVAIISHENGHFGNAKDTHPNQSVLELLQHNNVKILVTNDVIKDNITIMRKVDHDEDDYVKML